jgi:hypothetical protein
VVTRRRLPGDPKDFQSRYIEAAMDGMIVACLYAANGNPHPGPKFDYKLAWLKRLNLHAASLRKSGAPVVIAGDFNVVPTPLDICPTKSWDKDAQVQPEGRALFASLLKQGWTDAIRDRHQDGPAIYILVVLAQPVRAGRRPPHRSPSSRPTLPTASSGQVSTARSEVPQTSPRARHGRRQDHPILPDGIWAGLFR